jgi:hypothetical protein
MYADVDSISVMFMVAQYDNVEYMVDNVALYEIENDDDWEKKADERIEQLRKGNLVIK